MKNNKKIMLQTKLYYKKVWLLRTVFKCLMAKETVK